MKSLISISIAFLLSIMGGCCSSLADNAIKETESVMNENVESVEFELSGNNKLTISIKDLEQIKGELIAFLEQKDPEQYGYHLADGGLRRATPRMKPGPDGMTAIGMWRLVVNHNDEVLLRRQEISEHMRLIHDAVLVIENGRWRVRDMRRYVVHRRRF